MAGKGGQQMNEIEEINEEEMQALLDEIGPEYADVLRALADL